MPVECNILWVQSNAHVSLIGSTDSVQDWDTMAELYPFWGAHNGMRKRAALFVPHSLAIWLTTAESHENESGA